MGDERLKNKKIRKLIVKAVNKQDWMNAGEIYETLTEMGYKIYYGQFRRNLKKAVKKGEIRTDYLDTNPTTYFAVRSKENHNDR